MHNIGAKVMFIEVYNEDEQFLASHYRSTVQYSADYAGLCDISSVCDSIFFVHTANEYGWY
jgi:hypothetical protein